MTHDVERVLADIDADHGDRCVEFLRHGVLLVLSAPCQLLILAGPEHGRTIPLADIRILSNPSEPPLISFRRRIHHGPLYAQRPLLLDTSIGGRKTTLTPLP